MLLTRRSLCCAQRSYLAFAICVGGILYWLIWYNVQARPRLITLLNHRLSIEASLNCTKQLLLDFNIAELNLSAPTYVRFAQPRPVSSDCLSLIPKSSNASAINITTQQLFEPHEQAMRPHFVHRLFTNFSQRGLAIFLCGGSLLGSVRNFGRFPWDEDIDVMILTSQKQRVRQLLIELSATGEMRFTDTAALDGHWRVGIMCPVDHNQSSSDNSKKYLVEVQSPDQPNPVTPCRTFVDFFFGGPDVIQYRRKDYPHTFPMDDVYPLTVRPYGPYLLPVLRYPDKYLAAVYGSDYELNCFFKYFNNKIYKCADLRSTYPFVTHLRLSYHDRELSADLLVRGADMMAMFIPAQTLLEEVALSF